MFFPIVGVARFITSQRQRLVALGVPALLLSGECSAASGRQLAFAVLAGLRFQLGLLLQPLLPVSPDQGADVLVCGIWLTAASPGYA